MGFIILDTYINAFLRSSPPAAEPFSLLRTSRCYLHSLILLFFQVLTQMLLLVKAFPSHPILKYFSNIPYPLTDLFDSIVFIIL